MIREATTSDLDRIVELGSLSLKDGPYAGIIADNPEQSRKCAEFVLENGKVLLGEEDGTVVGLLGFILADHHFSGERYASELMWFVQPGHRKGALAIKLLWEAEKIAKDTGAKSMVFTAPSDAVAALYKRFGYDRLEVAFRKVF